MNNTKIKTMMRLTCFLALILIPPTALSLEIDIESAMNEKPWNPETNYSKEQKEYLDRSYKPSVISKLTRCYHLNGAERHNIQDKHYIPLRFSILKNGSVRNIRVENERYEELFIEIISKCSPFLPLPSYKGESIDKYEFALRFILHQQKLRRGVPTKEMFNNL